MSAHDFLRLHLQRMQGLMPAAIGAFLFLSAIVCGGWWPFSEAWRAAALIAVLALTYSGFLCADMYYEEDVPRPLQGSYVLPTFFATSVILLPAGVWVGHAISATMFVGTIWLVVYKRRVGRTWGFDLQPAVLLACCGSLLPFIEASERVSVGTTFLTFTGGALFLVGILEQVNLVRLTRRQKEEADELNL